MHSQQKRLVFSGIVCILLAFAMLFFLSVPTFGGGQTVSFSSTYKEHPVTLQGSYWSGDNGYAVLICPGYSCDRQKWRPFANVFASQGFGVMTFDYSGQGASSGTIGFDNAKTDAIPIQIDDAIAALHDVSGLDYDRIILVGHSMGGRAILRLLDDYNDPSADTTLTRREIRNVILLSPEVNYHYNAQASLFAGTSDESEEPWKSLRDECIAGTNVYLFGSTADDIVSDEDVLSIYRHLGGTNAPDSGECREFMFSSADSRVTVGITGGVLHSYMMYSPKFVRFVCEALTEITLQATSYPAERISLVYGGWFLGLLGLLLTLTGLNSRKVDGSSDTVPQLLNARAFLLRKLLLWIPGAAAAFLICCICIIMPFGSPVMNTPYMCFIAGYGLVMLLSYRKGQFKGTSGKLPKLCFRVRGTKKELCTCAAVTVLLCFFVWYVMRTTMYRLIPLNARLFWVVFAAVLMAAGYYVSGCESDMLRASGASRTVRLLYSLIQYVPLFLLVGFYLVLKSYSGMIGQIQNMLLMYIFCVPLGDFIRRKTHSRLYAALTTAFLFQTLMITSAALIAMF